MVVFRHVGFLLLSLVFVDAASLSGKDLYCRDPDTGKFHAINSTWASKTFCGHYTCRLRKRNTTDSEYAPLRTVKISNIHNKTVDTDVDKTVTENKTVTGTVQSTDNSVTETVQSEAPETRAIESIQNKIQKIVSKSSGNEESNTEQSEPVTTDIIETIDTDTPPTTEHIINVTIEENIEPEIEAVVYTNDTDEETSSSDINSIVTKEIIQKPEEKATEVAELLSEISKNKEDRYLTEEEIKSISEILHTVKKSDLDAIVDIYNLAQDIYNEMDKTTNKDVINDVLDIEHEKLHTILKPSYFYDPIRVPNKGRDMNFQSSNQVPTTLAPKQDIPAYLNGAMPNQENGKIPYYPVSLFQRSSSYIQPTQSTNIERPQNQKKPCKHKTRNMQTSQNLIKPSYLLPYPFAYIPHSNHTDYQNYPYYPQTYYYNYPWADYNRQQMRQYQPYYNAYIAQIPTAVPKTVLTNPHFTEDTDVVLSPVNNNVGNIIMTAKEEGIPEWKTEELSKQILDEVRANLDTTQILKAFPLRRKVKLEKVGKLIKLENLDRFRRETDDKLKVIHKEEPNMNVVNKIKTVKYIDVTELPKEITEATNKQDKKRDELHRFFMNKLLTLANKAEVTDQPTESLVAKDKQTTMTENLEAMVAQEDEYETFIEKKMCETHTEPGYFRVGNLSQPFPRCCPQLINNR